MKNNCYIIFKDDRTGMLSYITTTDNNIPSTIDNLALQDDEYVIIKGDLVKDIGESRMEIPVNLLRI